MTKIYCEIIECKFNENDYCDRSEVALKLNDYGGFECMAFQRWEVD